METNFRTLCKAVSWQVSGLIVMSLIGYVMTGSVQAAGGFALVTAAIGFVMFFVHEKIWSFIRWGVEPK